MLVGVSNVLLAYRNMAMGLLFPWELIEKNPRWPPIWLIYGKTSTFLHLVCEHCLVILYCYRLSYVLVLLKVLDVTCDLYSRSNLSPIIDKLPTNCLDIACRGIKCIIGIYGHRLTVCRLKKVQDGHKNGPIFSEKHFLSLECRLLHIALPF